MLNVEIEGEGQDIVLIHGWGMNNAIWSDFVPLLSAQYRVHQIELPGHGHNAVLQNNSIETWAKACLQVAPPQAIWLGWSLGGMIAYVAASIQPHAVSRLLVVASNMSFVQRKDWQYAMDKTVLADFSNQLTGDYRKTLNQFLALQVRGADNARPLLRLIQQKLRDKPLANEQALMAGLDMLRNVDLRNYVDKVTCSVDWILAARDTLVPVEVLKEIASLRKNISMHVIAQSAHAPFLSHPQDILSVLEND